MTIEMKPIKSSQITSIGYSADTKTLAILFNGGKSAYHYSNVEPEVFDALSGADSVGSYFYKHIKPNKDKYPFVKQPEKEEAGGQSDASAGNTPNT